MEGFCSVCDIACENYCTQCRTVFYCSAEHQKAHWTVHKAWCALAPHVGEIGWFPKVFELAEKNAEVAKCLSRGGLLRIAETAAHDRDPASFRNLCALTTVLLDWDEAFAHLKPMYDAGLYEAWRKAREIENSAVMDKVLAARARVRCNQLPEACAAYALAELAREDCAADRGAALLCIYAGTRGDLAWDGATEATIRDFCARHPKNLEIFCIAAVIHNGNLERGVA